MMRDTNIAVQRLVLLLKNVEGHLFELYGNTVADFESSPLEEEGWVLYCEVKAEKDRILKQLNGGEGPSISAIDRVHKELDHPRNLDLEGITEAVPYHVAKALADEIDQAKHL